MNREEFEKMCRHYYKVGDEEWIISTLLQYHEYIEILANHFVEDEKNE